ncbi:hypothetical protein CMEL01_05203, partial [Colletotrichum melonis]
INWVYIASPTSEIAIQQQKAKQLSSYLQAKKKARKPREGIRRQLETKDRRMARLRM